MKDGKFTNLPPQKSPPEDEPTVPEIDKSPAKATQTPYQQMIKRFSKAKAHVTTIRKTKKRKMNGGGSGFLQGLPSMSEVVSDRLGVWDATTVTMRDCLVISILMWRLAKRRG